MNRNPISPIAVYAPGFRLAVVSPAEDFPVESHGLLHTTSWSGTLSVTLEPLAPPPPPLVLSCGPAGVCSAKLTGSPDDFCTATLLEADASHATSTALLALQGTTRLGSGAAPAGLDVTFALPASPSRTATTDVFVVAECLPREGRPPHRSRFFVSDPSTCRERPRAGPAQLERERASLAPRCPVASDPRYEGLMSFGRNPHVAKAEAAEQKAGDAPDHHSRERAWREAAHLWERAAERETDAKRRAQYAARAEAAREKADAPADESPDARAQALQDVASKLGNPRLWN